MLASQPRPGGEVGDGGCGGVVGGEGVVDQAAFAGQVEPFRGDVGGEDGAGAHGAAQHGRGQADRSQAGDEQPVLSGQP